VRPLINRQLQALWAKTGELPQALNYNQLPNAIQTKLPTNLQTALIQQLLGQHKGWAANVKKRFSIAIARQSDAAYLLYLKSNGVVAVDGSEQDATNAVSAFKHQLHWVNKLKLWGLPYPEQQQKLAQLKQATLDKGKSTSGMLESLSIQASRLARKWFNNYLRRFKRPSIGNLPVPLTQLTGIFDPPNKRKSKAPTPTAPYFAHWLRLSTLVSGQRINLPLRANPFAKEKLGQSGCKVAKSMALQKDLASGDYYLYRYGEFETPSNSSDHVLAIDLGLNNLLATSDGDIEGADYLKKLRQYDYELQRIMKGLQKAGIKRYGACRRYQHIAQKIRGYIATLVNTAMKRLMDRRQPKVVIVEALSFRGSNLSRRMNRLLHFFGQGAFNKTLTKYEEERGIIVEKVPAAYTSQACRSCSFVSPKNRNGNVFQCKVCGKKAHADVNAAKNLVKRFHQCHAKPALTRLNSVSGETLKEAASLYPPTEGSRVPHTQWWSVLFEQHVRIINQLPLSSTRIIECARLVRTNVSAKQINPLLHLLTNRKSSAYQVQLLKIIEQL
jgi:transposase